MKKAPYRARMQGNLDGLCGVYSVINAVAHTAPKKLTDADTREIFRTLLSVLSENGKLEEALIDGLKMRLLSRLIDSASILLFAKYGYQIKRKLAFSAEPVELSEFWTRVQQHIEAYGTGTVILGMSGKHDHWTCVSSFSDDRANLIDSDGLRWLLRKNCTTSDARKGRHHVLWPTQTFLLSCE